MFDHIAKGKARKNRWKAPILMTGAVIHGALFTGMWVKGLWEIRKVDAAEVSSPLTLGPTIPVQEAPKGAPKPAEPKVKPPKAIARETTQPTTKPPEEKPVIDEPGGTDRPDQPVGTSDVDGPIGDVGSEIGDPPPQVTLPVKPPEPPKPPAPTPVLAPSKDVEQRRIAGERLILPDEATAQQIARANGRAEGRVQLCLKSDGTVSSVRMIKSTEFGSYDQKLLREMRAWRYSPYQVNGVATPVCTSVTFLYRQR